MWLYLINGNRKIKCRGGGGLTMLKNMPIQEGVEILQSLPTTETRDNCWADRPLGLKYQIYLVHFSYRYIVKTAVTFENNLLLLNITYDCPWWRLYFNFLKAARTTAALTSEGSGEMYHFSLHVVNDFHLKWTARTTALSSTTFSIWKITGSWVSRLGLMTQYKTLDQIFLRD